MAYKLDPDVEVGFKPMQEMKAKMPAIATHDVDGRRKTFEPALAMLDQMTPIPENIVKKIYSTKTADGHDLEMTWFSKTDAATSPAGPAILHMHGGGFILAKVSHFSSMVASLVDTTSVPILSVEYRYAPEHPHPTLVEDCFVALTWLRDNASTLSPPVNPARIGIRGESGGGGVAAGLALLARDRKFTPPIAKQILIYPMIDDRTTTPLNKEFTTFIGWSYEDNLTGWTALLGKDTVGTDKVSEYAAAARAKDVSHLPSTYIDTGELDVFCLEDIQYAARLFQAGVSVELHVYPGCPHGFEMYAPHGAVTQRALQNRIRATQSF